MRKYHEQPPLKNMDKMELREKIKEDVEKFLDNGGFIETVDPSESGIKGRMSVLKLLYNSHPQHGKNNRENTED